MDRCSRQDGDGTGVLQCDISVDERPADPRCPNACRPLCEANPVISFALDEEGNILDCSQYTTEQLGYTREELLGRSYLSLAEDEDQSAVATLIASCLGQQGVLAQGEQRRRRRDGTLLWVNERARAATGDVDRQVVFIVWEDVTQRHAAEAAIRESQARYRAIVEGIDGLVYICSADCRIEFMNRQLVERTGRDATGELCYAALHNRSSACPWCVNDRVMRGETVRWEVQSPRDNHWYYCVDTPIRHADGTISKQAVIQDITARKQNDQAQLRGITDSAQDAIVMMDPWGKISFWNPAAEKILGYTRDEAIGQNLHQLLVPERYLEAHTAAFSEFLRTGQGPAVGRTLEMSARRKDGHEIEVDLSLSALRLEGAWHAIGIMRDVTERKWAQKALASSEEKFRQMAENIHEVFWITTAPLSNVLYVSPAYEQVWGRSRVSLYQKPESMIEAIHPDDLPGVLAAMDRQSRGEAISAEYRIRTPEGEEKWILSRGFPVYDGAGTLIRVVGISEDITERKGAELALQQSEEKFRQLAENIREVFFVLDPTCKKTIYISPAYEHIWERSREPLYSDGTAWAEALHPDDAEIVRKRAAARAQGVAVTQEYRILTPAGAQKWIRSRSFPVRDRSGELVRVVGIAEEITQQKHYESELIHAREMAESANRAKSAFLATMSHELRTPLNAILGFTELLELEMREKGIADWQTDIRKIRHAGSHLLDLISDVMDLSKIEAGRLELNPTDFNLAGLIEEVMASVEPLAAKNRIELQMACEPATVRADRTRVRQCLFNLVGNACKFTEDGSVRVEASVDSEPGAWCTMRVVDTGIGMRPEDLERIFGAFTQVDASTSRKYGGSGLGLAISHRLVHMMGGDITVESTLGKGSTFTLRIPAIAPQSATGPHNHTKEEQEREWH